MPGWVQVVRFSLASPRVLAVQANRQAAGHVVYHRRVLRNRVTRCVLSINGQWQDFILTAQRRETWRFAGRCPRQDEAERRSGRASGHLAQVTESLDVCHLPLEMPVAHAGNE